MPLGRPKPKSENSETTTLTARSRVSVCRSGPNIVGASGDGRVRSRRKVLRLYRHPTAEVRSPPPRRLDQPVSRAPRDPVLVSQRAQRARRFTEKGLPSSLKRQNANSNASNHIYHSRAAQRGAPYLAVAPRTLGGGGGGRGGADVTDWRGLA